MVEDRKKFDYIQKEEAIFGRIKPVFRCREGDKEKFKNSQCLLTISVGQEVHEEKKFAATVDLVNQNFSSCILLVDDSLQRHSMAISASQGADFFYEKSIEEGDLWLMRNKQQYQRLTGLKKIIRWDTWLRHPNYMFMKNNILAVMKNDMKYRDIFRETASDFLSRYSRRLNIYADFNEKRAFQLCMDYLIEEAAALCLWTELECQFEVYPSKRISAMEETYARFILPNYPNLLRAVSIKFKNRKQLLPQKFVALDY